MKHQTPAGYEQKFSEFIKMCDEAMAKGGDAVLIAQPWVIGDTCEEIIESLGRLAKANLMLRIAKAQ